MRFKDFFEGASIVAGATLGAGIFTLPYVFGKAGWLVGLLYLGILGACVVFAHSLLLSTLEKNGDAKERLLGLAQKFLGRIGFLWGIVSIVLGLLFTLVIYLLLGRNFIMAAWPGAAPSTILLIFWAFVSIPFLFSFKRLAAFDSAGVIAVVLIVLFIASFGLSAGSKAADSANIWFPFAPVLFSLAGWTAIGSLHEFKKRLGLKKRWEVPVLGGGTLVVALLYVLFVFGITHSAPVITPDTISGLTGWNAPGRGFAIALGIFALSMSYLTISFEIERTFRHDLRAGERAGKLFVLFFPPALALTGLTDFFAVVGLVGGVFLGLQYLLIIRIADRALRLEGLKKFFAELVALVFILAVVYEIYRGFINIR